MFRFSIILSLMLNALLGMQTDVQAQRTCGAHAHRQWRLENDPNFAKWIKELQNRAKSSMCPTECTPITVPVAVHFNMTMPTDPQFQRTDIDCSTSSCLMQAVQNQIAEMNAAFNALSSTDSPAGDYQKYTALILCKLSWLIKWFIPEG